MSTLDSGTDLREHRWARTPADLDLSAAEAEFISGLPDVLRRRMIIRETSLEYRRLLELLNLGHHMSLVRTSLLAAFAEVAHRVGGPDLSSLCADTLDDSTVDAYWHTYAAQPSYPWSTSLERLADGGPQPQPSGP